MTEFYDRYYPTLCVRRSEMVAAEKLPISEKQRMLPIILFSPWMNAHLFDNTHERIARSFGKMPLLVDLDRTYPRYSWKKPEGQSSRIKVDRDNPAQRKFFQMLDSVDDVDDFIEIFQEHSNYIPCIQFQGKSTDAIQKQFDAFRELDRGIGLRFETTKPNSVDTVMSILKNYDAEKLCFILDAGYINHHNIQQLQFFKYMEQVSAIIPDAQFVTVSCNFPNDFTDIDDFETIPIEAREVHRLVQTQTNYRVYYGDWGSTKPRNVDGFGSPPLPRIDFPTQRSWIIARSKSLNWGFSEAAAQITRLGEWETRPNIWGADLVERTALGLPDNIYNSNLSIAARINMHLFIQNNYGSTRLSDIDTTEPWIDPA